MFIVSIIALVAYALVIGRCAVFLSLGGRFRQDDHAEIAFLMVSTVLLMLGHIQLWYAEPWKMVNNSRTVDTIRNAISAWSSWRNQIATLQRTQPTQENNRRGAGLSHRTGD